MNDRLSLISLYWTVLFDMTRVIA